MATDNYDIDLSHRKLVGEIDLIRAGKWDEQIHATLTGEPIPPQHETESRTELPELEQIKVCIFFFLCSLTSCTI